MVLGCPWDPNFDNFQVSTAYFHILHETLSRTNLEINNLPSQNWKTFFKPLEMQNNVFVLTMGFTVVKKCNKHWKKALAIIFITNKALFFSTCMLNWVRIKRDLPPCWLDRCQSSIPLTHSLLICTLGMFSYIFRCICTELLVHAL